MPNTTKPTAITMPMNPGLTFIMRKGPGCGGGLIRGLHEANCLTIRGGIWNRIPHPESEKRIATLLRRLLRPLLEVAPVRNKPLPLFFCSPLSFLFLITGPPPHEDRQRREKEWQVVTRISDIRTERRQAQEPATSPDNACSVARPSLSIPRSGSTPRAGPLPFPDAAAPHRSWFSTMGAITGSPSRVSASTALPRQTSSPCTSVCIAMADSAMFPPHEWISLSNLSQETPGDQSPKPNATAEIVTFPVNAVALQDR